jgi:recombination protein U
MKSEGKQFELDFKASVPSYVWFYRFKDGTANFNGQKNENVRFQAKNICDCELYYKHLFLLELKSTKEKRIPLSMIRDNQIKELTEAGHFEGILPGFVVNFRSEEETYFLDIWAFNDFVEQETRKSIPLQYFRDNCLKIEQERKRVRYKYNLNTLLSV